MSEIADETIALVRRWLSEAATVPVGGSAAQLAGLLRDPKGLGFAVGFVDGVVRPEDRKVSARTLHALAGDVPGFLPAHLRAAVKLGGALAPIMPNVVVPIARRALRQMVGHLIVDATDARLGRAIKKIKRRGVRLNVNLLGEAVLGRGEASRRLKDTERLLARADVDYVSIKVSSTVAPHNPWAFDEAVDDIVTELLPLFTLAARTGKFVNLDMEEYKDLDLTIAVFTRLLDRPDLLGLEAGIVLQAYLPDALSAMTRLQVWSASRRERGGAGIKVRLVKGANLPMERVEAALHGWPVATCDSKQATDTNYKRVLDYALQADRIRNVRIGVAGHNLFDVAYAWTLAGQRGVRDGIEFEMLLGMAEGQAEAVRREVGGLLLYTPVVRPEQFDVAIAYLIRRLEEGASSDNFMSAVFELHQDEALFEREKERFLASLRDLDDSIPAANRVADRHAATPAAQPGHFANSPDTDPAVAANRTRMREILSRVPTSQLGTDIPRIAEKAALDELLGKAAAANWGAADRRAVLHQVGDALERNRDILLEVMAAEAGKTIDQADPEVSEAIDFAHYYAELSAAEIDGATPVPARVTLVTPPWNFPVAIPAGSMLAALAAGSAVVIKPAGPAERCGTVLTGIVRDALAAAGADPDLVTLLQVDEGTLGRELVAHPLVDRVILTGAYETAELFRSFRADLPLLAETSGKNAIIVTPSADLDLAVKDVVASAFGHAGQKCSAASLVVLVGSVARSERFRTQLLDAVSSLAVGWPWEVTTQVGPLVEPAAGKLLDGLTTLGAGESWLLQPRQLDENGQLWSPGIRDGVRRGSAYHRTEYFGPILGIMTAATLDEAIDLVNEVDFGLTSGLHSLDAAEVRTWLDRAQAGNLYVNRGITGAIVRRQPFGGWKRSAVGPGTKAGGPNYLIGLSGWAPGESSARADIQAASVRSLLADCAALVTASTERAARSDAAAWAASFGRAEDVSDLGVERNVLRYLPTPVTIRLADGGSPTDLVRVLAAGLLTGAPIRVSSAVELPAALAAHCPELTVESDEAFAAGLTGAGRVRLIGGSASELATATGGRPDLAIWAGPVVEAGRVELLPFLREQAVSITAHRFGNPLPMAAEVL
ncbi:RHH-type proline utilization regulon transcriptional repressor/proline dehydrogenase/delta 1-pyrroline-5-carboxylate dehydrogenase [Actinoplanes octamycinicus]|uniref:L-glutamate gamma-semialdehyde dehydrogenase n=1 Tax=Actinoplanes octamycinicus TaxID=135948 RepID=A0A7W7H6F7_9ACTN|nr:proline dehydrogenase family protein [Actinoplanes octamycinicus]MBB4744758.1 RHH-type proline utilization regulon transcriptional repressor/proline dehydrogenase/delta 1-pyrroline-5-carboxylate dehydrogenase [Actinoplanes octamycinicus]GIE55340.1 1-pyrroline-5-carboxylate dehydrogenase [Actinoplanes octamycinicus]